MTSPYESHAELAQTPFRRALAASGLVDGLVLHRVAVEVAANHPESPEEQDRLYAEILVGQGRLNRWQIDQLKQGRTKFTLGPYQIVNAIGRGGMGYVFLGEHELLGRVEAIKVLPRTKTSPETIANFRHEIRSQAQLDHPNLVRVSFADRDKDTYFLVTEYVPGIDLRRLIRRLGALEERLAAWVVSEAARGIEYAHQRQLVHRDIKPGNVLLTNDGDVKVTDLGLAWCLEGSTIGTGSPSVGKIVGTSDYLAPETIRDPTHVTPVSDVYSLGCTLYYTITGKVPYPGGTHLNKMKRHLQEQPANPRRFCESLSDEILEYVDSMMARKPSNRMQSAAQVCDSLCALLKGDEPQQLSYLIDEALSHSDADSDSLSRGSSDDDPGEDHGLPETVCVTIDSSADVTPQPILEEPISKPIGSEPSVAEPSSKKSPNVERRLYTVASVAVVIAAALMVASLVRSLF